MHIILTRTEEDSLNLAEKLNMQGHLVTQIPVIKIKKLEFKKIDFEKYKKIIFTSSNAIKFLDIKKINFKVQCYCVGRATELAAKRAGFTNIYSSEGTVDSLIELIIRTSENKLEKMLYLSSEFVSRDLDGDLKNAGFLVDRIKNYTTLPVEKIDPKKIDLLKKNIPDAIFVYSSQSAKNLFNLINKYSLLNIVTHSNLMCISEKTLLELKKIKWKKKFLFNPGEEELLLDKI